MNTLSRLSVLIVVLLAPLPLLVGFGLAGTGVTAAAAGQSAAQQAAEARQTEDQVKQRLDEAAQQDAARRAAGEAQSQ